MHIKKIDTTKISTSSGVIRPQTFEQFIGQTHIMSVLQTAIDSAHKNAHQLGHILLCGPSGFGKTTLAHIVGNTYGKHVHTITGYAIVKPADIISLLTGMQSGDILFIDEIHRIKPNIEEMLYIAMEDMAIDMVMPDGGTVRVPLKPFTLIGATTKPESMTEPLKNRFVYMFHCIEYTHDQKIAIVQKYIDMYGIRLVDPALVVAIAHKVESVPRKIHNLIVKIRDFLISTSGDTVMHMHIWEACDAWLCIQDGGLTHIHQKYMDIVQQSDAPIGLKTISLQLGISEKAVETEIEPLLLKLGKINKTSRGRVLV